VEWHWKGKTEYRAMWSDTDRGKQNIEQCGVTLTGENRCIGREICVNVAFCDTDGRRRTAGAICMCDALNTQPYVSSRLCNYSQQNYTQRNRVKILFGTCLKSDREARVRSHCSWLFIGAVQLSRTSEYIFSVKCQFGSKTLQNPCKKNTTETWKS